MMPADGVAHWDSQSQLCQAWSEPASWLPTVFASERASGKEEASDQHEMQEPGVVCRLWQTGNGCPVMLDDFALKTLPRRVCWE
jgi:hypothetical protein